MNDPIETFYDLFRGRTEAYGTWEGGCQRSPANIEAFKRHLYGEELIGIYPLTDESTVRWGCSDIDVDDLDMAYNLSVALKVKGIHPFIEKTKRGFHVWVFANDWVPAPVMRRAFLAAHEAVGIPAKEVNPKQEECTGLGNYVRLPYPDGMNRLPEARYMLGDDEQPIGLSEFLDKALLNRVNVHMLAPLAELHKPRSVFKLHTPPSADVRVSLLGADALVRHIWKNGPSGKFDRSNTLVRLAYKCKDCGMSAEDAYVVVTDADKRWGKFHLRPDAEEHIAKIIARAYSEEQS